MKAAIITASTLGYQGFAEDGSGPVIKRMAEKVGFEVTFMKVLPDDRKVLSSIMEKLADGGFVDIIFTTGGVGLGEKDVIPEATQDVLDRELSGIPEAMRAYSIRYTKRAILDRCKAGIRKKTLIVNFPASPKHVNQCLDYIMPELVYTVEVLTGAMEEVRE